VTREIPAADWLDNIYTLKANTETCISTASPQLEMIETNHTCQFPVLPPGAVIFEGYIEGQIISSS
jgi:hypothetical protein